MTSLGSLHGELGALVVCILLFAEETGVPIPLVPGDLLLVAAGLLIANGDVSPWLFLPLAMAAAAAGTLVGYSWTRMLGAAGVRALAARFRLTRHVDRLEARLQSAGPVGIALCRLFPGMRVNTTLLAGALGVKRRNFVLGVFPAIVLWVIIFTSLGALIGAPVEHLVSVADRWAIGGGILVAVGVGGYLAARHVPALRGSDDDLLAEPGWRRIALAAAIDLGTIASVVAGLDVVGHTIFQLGEPDGWSDVVAVTALTSLAYLLLSRSGIGLTAGEAILRLTYRHRPGSPESS